MVRIKRLLFSLVCLAGVAWGQGYYSIERELLKAQAPIPAAIKKSLNADGTRLINSPDGKKAPLCELWLSKVVSAYPKAVGSADASYGELETGTLLGVIYFPKKARDARGQELPPGYYTMRYVQMPQDNAHETVTSYPDFVALSPVAADTKSHETLALEPLMELSRRASRTRHPAVIGLVPTDAGYSEFPGLVPGQAILQVKIKVRKGNQAPEDLKLAIALIPPSPQDTGS